MKTFYASLLCLFVTICYAQDFELETFATGLDRPVNMQHANDSRLFVVEQDGYITIVNADGTLNATPFLDIDPLVINLGGIGDEKGLLGLAFHPDYATNGFFYVYYINNSGNSVLSRFSRSTTDDDLADNTTELIILTFTQPFGNHNGGGLAFGTDGYLYISTGDGGAGGDPGDRAQDLTTLLGKMLRIDVDNPSGGNNYGIPADNPFVGSASAMEEIWAYGLRNPWKFSFDRDTNDLWIADVGQNAFEEIDMVAGTEAGVNYGWRCYEADAVFNLSGDCPDASTLTFPVGSYSHAGGRCSITGGYRYRGSDYPNFEGLYFFADYCSTQIGALENNGGTWDMTLSTAFSGNNWSTFGEDMNGEIYIVAISNGTIYKITDPNLGVDESIAFNIKLYPNPGTDELNIDFSDALVSLEKVEIYSLQGQMVHDISNFSDSLINVSTRNFSEGMYFVKLLTSDGNQAIMKFVKR